MAASKKTTKKSTSRGTKKSDKAPSYVSQRSNPERSPRAEKKAQNKIGRDIAVIVMALISVVFFLGNIKLAGDVGDALRKFQLGLFGIIGYLFPLLFGFISIYLIICLRNDGIKTVFKSLGILAIFVALSAVAALMGGDGMNGSYTASDFYKYGPDGLNGGLVGGILGSAIAKSIGSVAAYFIFIFAIIIFLLLITGRSLIDPIADAISRRKEYAKEHAEEDKAYREEKRQLRYQEKQAHKTELRNIKLQERREEISRLEKKARGVEILDINSIPDPVAAADAGQGGGGGGAESTEKAESAETATPGELRIHGVEPQGGETPIILNSGIRTQAELSAIDNKAAEPDEEWHDALGELFDEDKPQSKAPAKKEHIDVPEVLFGEGENPQGKLDINAISGAEAKPAPESIWSDGHYREDSGSAVFSEAGDIKKARKPRARRNYKLPPLTLLEKGGNVKGVNSGELKSVATTLEQTLRNFGVGATVTDVSVGPTVTRYELHPDQGVKISRIVALTNDIKLSLAATDIRIEAPIPGKAAVGIEVPNVENVTVHLRDILESDNFKNSKTPVTFGVGKDIGGEAVTADISKMPHLLIAGATGSGKSVCINTIITSILYKATPDEVRFIMIDPKQVELKPYASIPHLMVPIVTDTKKAAGALNWAIVEMERRYKMFADTGVRDIIGYNEQVVSLQEEYDAEEEHDADVERPEKLCRLVIIVDEMADLMMVSPHEVEDAICRLAQLARAAGIHLVLATQRPSVNVITGLIKANIPSRIAFSVSSGIDSRIIIDTPGAERLLGKGDMLFFPLGIPKPVRVQGAFVSDGEVENVVSFWTTQRDEATIARQKTIDMEVAAKAGKAGGGSDGPGMSDDFDELFEECGRFIIENDKGSIGNLQRRFKIGFNRAARIMDALADAGVVGPDEGKKPREVLMTIEQFEEYVENM